MTSDENKLSYDEKNGSPASSEVEPIETGNVSNLRRRFPGFNLEVRQEESSFAATKSASNADFDPIPPSKRTWNWGAYVAYWMADAWAVSNWEVGEFPVTCFICEVRERNGAETLVVQLLL
jgi:NCS1 family nucleobase:cation symporter-1